MDIRSFFNSEYSKLQISNENTVREAEKTSRILDRHINEFEQLNRILKGFLQDSNKDEKKNVTKEVTKFRNYQRELVSSVKNLITPEKTKTEKITETKFNNKKFVLSNIKMSKVEMKNVVIKISGIGPVAKTSQSLQNYDISESNPLMIDKITILRRIDKNLSNRPGIVSGEAEKESEGGGFGNISGIVSGLLGGSLFSKIFGKLFPKASMMRAGLKIFGKTGIRTIQKAGKKAIPVIGAVFSVYDLFKTIKLGISDYNKYTQAGDYQAASGVISSSLMGAFGNIINIIGAFLPPPLDIAALTVGTGMELVSNTMASKNGRTSGFIGDARNKTAIAKKTISVEQAKGEFVELRPNFKNPSNIYWEYNNGSDWIPVKDSGTGKNLSAMKDRNPIIPTTDPKKPGIQTYQISTKHGVRDIVMKNGQLFMNVPNVGLLPLSTRKQGGSVVKNKTYLVGEHRAETYVPSKKNEEILNLKTKIKKDSKKSIEKIDNSFKLIDDSMLSIKNFLKSGSSTKSPIPAPSDMTSTTAGGIVPGKTYKTLDLSKGAKTEFGQRFAKVKEPLKNASDTVGVPLETLVKFAHIESSLNVRAGEGRKRGSAKGLFQFVDRTWSGELKNYATPGNKYGLSLDSDVLDPSANAMMGALYLKKNMNILKQAGLSLSEQNLYLLHFAGPTGGVKLIKTALSNPNAIAADLFPDEASLNEAIFYSNPKAKTGPRTLQEVYDLMGQKMAVDVSYMNSFDVGSWKLDSDQEAFIHQGEMIIPQSPANKIRSLAKSGKMEINIPQMISEYDIYSDASFWINTFMPALANVVLSEFGEVNG